MGINAITNVGISLVTVGKKYLSNQNVSSESLWFVTTQCMNARDVALLKHIV